MLSWLLALSLAATPEPTVRSETVRTGAPRSRLAADDADLVLFYASEHRGKMGTCGCPANPRGSISRLDRYVGLARRDTPAVLVHAGWWAADDVGDTVALRDDARVANAWMLEGLDAAGFDVVNLGYRDTPWLRDVGVPARAVSANGGAPDLAPDRYRIVEAGPYRVAVTGVSRLGAAFLQPEGWVWSDPVAAVADVVADVGDRADLVVVLAFDLGKEVAAIAALDGVDVVVEASGFAGKDPPWFEGGTAWVRARAEGASVGELRLWLDGGNITAIRDRWVDLDLQIPPSPAIGRMERRAARETDAALAAWFGGDPDGAR